MAKALTAVQIAALKAAAEPLSLGVSPSVFPTVTIRALGRRGFLSRRASSGAWGLYYAITDAGRRALSAEGTTGDAKGDT